MKNDMLQKHYTKWYPSIKSESYNLFVYLIPKPVLSQFAMAQK